MREYWVTLTGRGQVTIPIHVRRTLDLKPGDKVRFIVQGDQVQIAPVKFTIESVFGSVHPLPGVEISHDFKREINDAKDEHAARLIRDLKLAEARHSSDT